MSLSADGQDTQTDWEVTSEGLYIATQQFLLRRGYCCSNRCRNCPYVNWRDNPAWRHAPAEAIQKTRVSARTLAEVREQLSWHEHACAQAEASEQACHTEMIAHYRLLLERWR
jgi:hypothetical protein